MGFLLLGHLPVRPALSAKTRKVLRQFRHWNTILSSDSFGDSARVGAVVGETDGLVGTGIAWALWSSGITDSVIPTTTIHGTVSKCCVTGQIHCLELVLDNASGWGTASVAESALEAESIICLPYDVFG